MKIALDVKNLSKVIKPTTNDVILFNGKEWYVTTKDDLFKEINKKVDKRVAELDEVIKDNAEFKKNVSSQILEMSEIIKKLYSK